MKKIILLLFVCSAFLLKADTHYVNAGMYYYAPATISINTGDTVIWINDGGYHNVNGDSNSIQVSHLTIHKHLVLKQQVFKVV